MTLPDRGCLPVTPAFSAYAVRLRVGGGKAALAARVGCGGVNQEGVARWFEVRLCRQASVSRRRVRRAGEDVLGRPGPRRGRAVPPVSRAPRATRSGPASTRRTTSGRQSCSPSGPSVRAGAAAFCKRRSRPGRGFSLHRSFRHNRAGWSGCPARPACRYRLRTAVRNPRNVLPRRDAAGLRLSLPPSWFGDCPGTQLHRRAGRQGADGVAAAAGAEARRENRER